MDFSVPWKFHSMKPKNTREESMRVVFDVLNGHVSEHQVWLIDKEPKPRNNFSESASEIYVPFDESF